MVVSSHYETPLGQILECRYTVTGTRRQPRIAAYGKYIGLQLDEPLLQIVYTYLTNNVHDETNDRWQCYAVM